MIPQVLSLRRFAPHCGARAAAEETHPPPHCGAEPAAAECPEAPSHSGADTAAAERAA